MSMPDNMIRSPFHYYRDRLKDPRWVKLYTQFEEAVFALQTKLDIPYEPWMDEMIEDCHVLHYIFERVYSDQPGMYFVNLYSAEYQHSRRKLHFRWKLMYPVDEIPVLNDKLKQELDRIAGEISAGHPGMGELEKEKRIYDYIIKHVTYDYATLEKTAFEDVMRLGKGFEIYSIVGALLHKHAVCQGIAGMFKLLCDRFGIPAIVLTGQTEGGRHAWNMVRIGGRFYQVDCTWCLHGDWQKRATVQRYRYFNIPDSLMGLDHRSELPYMPRCWSYDQNPYKILNLLASTVEEFEQIFLLAAKREKHYFAILCAEPLFSASTPQSYWDGLFKRSGMRINRILVDSTHRLQCFEKL